MFGVVLFAGRSTRQYESQSRACSGGCGLLRRRAFMEVKCLDGIGRESWEWGVPHALASPGSPPSGGKKPSPMRVPPPRHKPAVSLTQ